MNFLHENILIKFDHYIKRRIRKGIPSIFSDIKSLLIEHSRRDLIIEYIKLNVESLRDHNSFLDSSSNQPSAQIEQPQSLM